MTASALGGIQAAAKYRHDLYFVPTVVVLSVLGWLPQANAWLGSLDFASHGNFIANALNDGQWLFANIPHFMFHVLSIGVIKLTGSNIPTAMNVVTIGSIAITTVILFMFYRLVLNNRDSISWTQGILVTVVTISVLIVAPINLWTPTNLYFGYFPPTVFHNPTMFLMKPSALLLFFAGLACFNAQWQPRSTMSWCVGFALLTLFCLYSKPSFIITFLPALAVITVFFIVTQRRIHWRLLILGIIIPAGLALFLQTQLWTSFSGVRFAPLGLYDLWVGMSPLANQGLLLKHVASILLPAMVYLLYWRQTVFSLLFNLAWLTFIVSLIYMDLLLDRFQPESGNFSWGIQFAVFLLFIVALSVLLKQVRDQRWDFRLVLSVFVLCLHLVSGVHWYQINLMSSQVFGMYW